MPAFWCFISSFLRVLWITLESWCLPRPHEQGHLETIKGEWSSTWPASLCESAQNTMDQRCVINVILNQTWMRTMLHCWTVCPEEPVSPVHLGRIRSVTWWKTFPFNLWTIQLNWIGPCPKTHVSEVNVHRIWTPCPIHSSEAKSLHMVRWPWLQTVFFNQFWNQTKRRFLLVQSASSGRETGAWDLLRPLHPVERGQQPNWFNAVQVTPQLWESTEERGNWFHGVAQRIL